VKPEEPVQTKHIKIKITVNGKVFTGELYDDDAAHAFANMLPLTLSIDELNGNEKYHFFDSSLPTDPFRPAGIHTGDLMLYGNNCLVLFYKDFTSSYSYTPLGRLNNPAGLAAALGTQRYGRVFAGKLTQKGYGYGQKRDWNHYRHLAGSCVVRLCL